MCLKLLGYSALNNSQHTVVLYQLVVQTNAYISVQIHTKTSKYAKITPYFTCKKAACENKSTAKISICSRRFKSCSIVILRNISRIL